MEPDVKINRFDTQKEIDVLVRKITMDICRVVRTFTPKRVIIACDAHNAWRHEIYKEIDGEDYKGNRERSDERNWDNIFSALSDLMDILKDNGFIVTYLDNTEADDIAAMWKEYSWANNNDIILVSSDMDWVQLVGMSDGNNVCACLNPIANNKGIKRFYMDEAVLNWVNEDEKPDIFFKTYNQTRKSIKNAHNADNKIQFEVIDPNMVLLNKVMAGDRGDNVPAFWDYYRNGKKQNVTELKAKHVFEALDVHNINDLIRVNESMMLKDALEKEMKHEVDVDFHDRMYRQRRLVELKSELFPKNIVDNFYKFVSENADKCTVNTAQVRMDDIVSGTKYEPKKSPEGKMNSIFDDIDSLSKYSVKLF